MQAITKQRDLRIQRFGICVRINCKSIYLFYYKRNVFRKRFHELIILHNEVFNFIVYTWRMKIEFQIPKRNINLP